MSVSSFETDEGSVSAEQTPHPPSRSAKAPSPTRGEGKRALRFPLHLQYRPSRRRIHVLAGMHEAVALIKANGSGVVLVDQKRDATGRQAFGFVDQCGGQFRAPVTRADHELVEVAVAIDGH